MSYHKLNIHKHSVNSPYKIQEEFLEYIDAIATGNKVMAIQELSDLYGCLENEIRKYGMNITDLKVMSDLTKEVFKSGTRTQENFLDYLQRTCDKISNWGLGFIQVKCGDINYNFDHKDLELFYNYDSPHSHQQDFVSEIISGSISETLFKVIEGNCRIYCGCGESNNEMHGDYEVVSNSTHNKGYLYLRQRDDFHSVKAEHGTITKVTKYGSDKVDAWVISEDKLDKIKQLSEEVLWEMVQEVYDVFN